jgi:cob(I)alamin adenosyltransferase
MRIYTRTGDRGETSLFGAGRVAKSHVRVAAYGDVDELNAVLGTVLATEPRDLESALLTGVQRDLLSIGGQLASPAPDQVAGALEKAQLPDERVAELESTIDRMNAALPELTAFVLPGGTVKAALLHQARTVCRRAERSVVALRNEEQVPAVILTYLNRLSDMLFVLARAANHHADVSDSTW